MNNPDVAVTYDALDPAAMHQRIGGLADQCQAAYSLAYERGEELRVGEPEKIVLAGMGSSGLAAELARQVLSPQVGLPIEVTHGYQLPAYAKGSSALVIVVSVSGNNEETLAVFDEARAAGCRLIALTTGGALADRARVTGTGLLPFAWSHSAREAFGWIAFSLLGMLARMRSAPRLTDDVAETAAVLAAGAAALGIHSPATRNPAKRIAGQFMHRLPIIYGSALLAPVAARWRTQLNENAKMLAINDEMPELSHNSIAGYENAAEIWRRAVVVALRSSFDHPRVQLRYDIARQIMLETGVNQDTVTARGASRLAQAMSLVQFGDWVSYFTAIMSGVDPSPVTAIAGMKLALADSV